MTRRTASRRSSLATRSNCALLGLASGGVYRADRSPDSLVRSYRTVSPLPRHTLASQRARSAVYFLWHCPGPCERWALPTTVSCEARTFLGEITLAAAARPAPRRHCTGRLRPAIATLNLVQDHRLFHVGWDKLVSSAGAPSENIEKSWWSGAAKCNWPPPYRFRRPNQAMDLDLVGLQSESRKWGATVTELRRGRGTPD